MKNNIFRILILFVLPVLLLVSCEKDSLDKESLITGLWVQDKILEEGVELNLPDQEKNLSILIESNGVYRSYAKDADVKEQFGSWTVTDNKWVELTANSWKMVNDPLSQAAANQWKKNHIIFRFTIMNISNEVLELRLKTYIGTKKYSALFVENSRPTITVNNFEPIDSEFKTLKTYTYFFRKSN